MTPEQLRELIESLRNGSPLPTDDAIALAIAHADALEEIERLKHDLTRATETGAELATRAASAEAALAEAERKCERLKFHADAMYLDHKLIADSLNGLFDSRAISLMASATAYRAEFKEES